MSKFYFSKYHGLGNDFIIIDGRYEEIIEPLKRKDQKFISNLCNRHFGIGADGILVAKPSSTNANISMQVFNSDGSEAEMCGNGLRCMIKFIVDSKKESTSNVFLIDTLAGQIKASITEDSLVRVNMGRPTFNPTEIPCNLERKELNIPSGKIIYKDESYKIYAAGMGNPHMITYLEKLVPEDLNILGPYFECNKSFPQRTNVHFVNILDKENFNVYVWERGSGPTLACGTGACAVVATSIMLNLSKNKVNVNLPGGSLFIDWPDINGPIYKTGPAQFIYKGIFNF